MSSAKQNRSIARLIVGAMSIDGTLDEKEAQKVANTLRAIGMGELVADVGAVIEDGEYDTVNIYQECKNLGESLGSDSHEISPLIFRIITDVVAHDRFVSEREAAFLSSMAKRLGLNNGQARKVFKEVIAQRRSRLEVTSKSIDETINPDLKDLLSFAGADEMVGEVEADSLEELYHNAQQGMEEGAIISQDEFARAMTILGLDCNAKLEDAEEVWRETINNLNLPKMVDLGETFVSAAISRITRINDAYKTILHFHSHLHKSRTPELG